MSEYIAQTGEMVGMSVWLEAQTILNGELEALLRQIGEGMRLFKEGQQAAEACVARPIAVAA